MKPYYEHAGITIYHGDCREVLGCLPVAFCRACRCELGDEAILGIHLAAGHDVGPFCDLLATDPPYGLGAARRNFRGNRVRRHMTGLLAGKCVPKRDYGDAEWDDEPADPVALARAITMTQWQIIFGGNYFELCGAFAKPNEIQQIEQHYPATAARIHALEDRARIAGKHCVWGVRPNKKLNQYDIPFMPMCSSCTVVEAHAEQGKQD